MGSTNHIPGETDGRSSSGGATPNSVAAGPRDENSVVISLSALLAVEQDAATKAAGARAEQGPKGSGMVDIHGLAAGDEQQRSSYLEIFPFGSPELPAFRPPDLTPVPSEVPIDLRPPRARRAVSVRHGVMGLVGAAVVASAAWLGAPRETLHAAAQPGVRSAASAALSRLPEVEAKAPAATAAAPSARQGDKASDRSARGAKARPAAAAGAGKAPAKRAAGSSGPAAGAAAPPPSQGGSRAASDPCKGDLDCAMRRATGGS
ncbi:hypothetical protein [Sorangium sp. So ce1078]|uniref:hypothetical protein n=1 Tax=Sorangium sp. So ce1078 TaxID=3133329 RepID=UPI003F638FC6